MGVYKLSEECKSELAHIFKYAFMKVFTNINKLDIAYPFKP